MPYEESTRAGRPTRSASVAALTGKGPREVNEDRTFTTLSDDGAWVIAVADGLGGHPRGDEAAQAAVKGLPQRIDSKAEMAAAFAEADEQVPALSGPQRGSRRAQLFTIPMSTLAVAYGDMEWLWDDSPAGIGSAYAPDADDASDIARSVLAKSRSLGLNDNATVAVAHWRRCPDR